MKNKIIISSILTIALCFSLIAGSTFALFTSDSTVNVAVTAGTVKVVATPGALTLGSTLGENLPETSAVANGNEITLTNFVPGDYVEFTITVTNESTVSVNYRTIIKVVEDNDLFDGLVVTIGDSATAYDGNTTYSSWASLAPDTKDVAQVKVRIELPSTAGNVYQGKSCKLSYTVEASQGNAIPANSYEDLTSARGTSNDYTLSEDISADNYIFFGEGTQNTIDLNGNTITAQNKEQYLFVSQGTDTTLVIEGDGTVDCGKGFFASSNGNVEINGGTFEFDETSAKEHIYCQNSATVVINNGEFITSDANALLLYCINGYIEINGGFFQNTANPGKELISCGNNLAYVNNQKITLRGGTFVNWNPMSSAYARPWTNPDVPAIIVLADGYEMISETQENGDVWYMVVPVSE